jgi:transposase
LEGAAAALAGKEERKAEKGKAEKELKKRIKELERTLGRKTHELEIAGEALRGWE